MFVFTVMLVREFIVVLMSVPVFVRMMRVMPIVVVVAIFSMFVMMVVIVREMNVEFDSSDALPLFLGDVQMEAFKL